MFVYVLLVILILVFDFLCNAKDSRFSKVEVKFFRLMIILITIISAVRNYTVGIDTKQFIDSFDIIKNLKISEFNLLRYEYGFTFFCWILSKISTNSQILLIVSSVIINFSIGRFIEKNSKNKFLSLILYIVCNFYFSYMNIMREAIAIAIFLIGFEFIKEKKYLKYSIFVLVASLFHSSAILGFLLIPISMFNKKSVSFLIFLVLTTFSFIFSETLFSILSSMSERLLDYAGSKFVVGNYFGSLIDFFVYFSVVVLYIYILNVNNKKLSIDERELYNFNIKILIIGVLFLSMTTKIILFNRFAPYFTIFSIICIPNCLYMIEDTKNKLFTTIGIVFLFILYWIIIMNERPEWFGVIPYKMFF